MQVCLQDPRKNTCVPCAVVNVLRHFLLDPDVEGVIEAMRLPHKHGQDGSYLVWAAKHLRRHWNMDCLISRPPHTIMDPEAAAIEIAYRYESLLADGRIGLIDRKETAKSGHAVVLHKIMWDRGEPYFVCYDSNKRDAGGHWVYKVRDYVFWKPETEHETEDEEPKPEPTGRIGYFVRPSSLQPLAEAPERSPSRSRRDFRRPSNTGADGPPGG